MAISEGFLLSVAGFGIIQAFMLAGILFFHPKGEKSVVTFLALYIITLVLPLFIPLVQQLISWQMIMFVEPFTLLIGPLLYLYVCSYKEPVTWKKAWPHFVLFAISYISAIYMNTVLSQKYPPSTEIPPEVITSPLPLIRSIVRILQMFVYYILARRALDAYQRSIQHLYSDISRINLSWVRWLINGYLFLLIVMITIYVLMLKYPDQFSILILINIAIVTPYIYIITFRGMRQPTLWQLHPGQVKEKVQEEIHEVEDIPSPSQHADQKSQKPIGVSEKTNDIVARTIHLMQEEKIFQETELSLQELADKLRQPAYVVSQAINEGFQKNFYDLVNGYRVEEAKKLLLNPKNQHYKILSVGFEAGFNSKTTFNTVFKKFTGYSPSEYREKHNSAPVVA